MDPNEAGCRICGNARGNRTWITSEMMYGSREPFTYVECSSCGAVQIAAIPPDLNRHYANDYYSMKASGGVGGGRVQRWVRGKRAQHLFGGGSLFGRLVAIVMGKPSHASWLSVAGVGFDSSILDVGCGFGSFLRLLQVEGFRHLRGIDAFLDGDGYSGNGLTIDRTPLQELQGSFDLVMLHHSLEHMPDQAAALREVRRLLKPTGTALVRVPLVGRWAWRTYGVHWVQIDAPRHLCLHSRESFGLLARWTGFDIVASLDDSTELQFWGSELYRRGVPLRGGGGDDTREGASGFTPSELRNYRRKAAELNAVSDGDQACFWLRPAS